MSNHLKLNWATIDKLCLDLSKRIIGRFDCIVSIGRGGMIPSRLLSELLDIKKIYYYDIIAYDGEKRREKPILSEPHISGFLKDKRVLAVDDLVDSGITTKFVLYDISYHSLDVKLATLIVKTKAEIIPDFWSITTNHDTWIDFPWETITERK